VVGPPGLDLEVCCCAGEVEFVVLPLCFSHQGDGGGERRREALLRSAWREIHGIDSQGVRAELIVRGSGISCVKENLAPAVLRPRLGSELINGGGHGATPPSSVVDRWSSLEATPPTGMVDWRPPRRRFFWPKGGHLSSRPVCQMGGSDSGLASSMVCPWRHHRPKWCRPRRRRCCARAGEVLIAFSSRLLGSSFQILGTKLYVLVLFGFVSNMYCLFINISSI
jgi:hypothetical protein